MADQRTMAVLFQAPTEGYRDAIVILAILAENFKLKHGLLNLITSTIKYKDVPNASIKLMLFPFSIEGAARIWLEKEPPRSITTWEDLVSKFINPFFPPSKTTNLRNEITNFQQRFDESFCKAWEHFKDLLRACPHHGFMELHQIDTFYNSLTSADQDSLNAAAGGNLLTKTPKDALILMKISQKFTLHETDQLLPNTLQTQTSNTLYNAIMEAGGKDRPPMVAPGNYVQWKSIIKRYIDTKPNHELIHYCLKNPPYIYQWADKDVPVAEGSTKTTTKQYMENYKNVSQDIRDQLNAEAEVVQIILTGIDNDIHSIVDACPNACEMWKAIKRLKQGESINVQDLETNLYWEFRKFTSRDGESLESYNSRFYKMMNELVRNQCDVTNHQVNVQFLLQLQPEWQRFVTLVKQSQELKTISYHKLYDILKQLQNEVNKLKAERLARTANPLALVAQQQSAYHPQNHPTHYTQNSSTRSQQAATRNRGKAIVNSPPPNLRTSSNTSRANQDNSLRVSRGTWYDNQRIGNVAWARETVGITVVQKSKIQCYNCKEFGHVAKECHKPKRAKDAAYHKEKMLFEHPKQSKSVHDTYSIEQDEHNVLIDSLDMSYDREQLDQDDDDDLANEQTSNKVLVDKLKGEIKDFKNKNKSLESSNNHFKEANNELSKTNELMYKDLKKFQAELDRHNDVKYASKMEIDCAKAKEDLMSYKMESEKSFNAYT
nr:reverse transcriptase domain-containing protein [Tanacetum cinerariifolium]